MKALVKICIFLVGALFIFSGFVKADDPLGFSYKLQEYFEAFGPGWKWAIPFSLPLASFIPVLEMILGFMALIGCYKRFTLWMLFLMDLFFTFLTFYTAHYNKVLECGCFGDAISMTPWVTFWKDVVILVIIGVIALGNKHYTPVLPKMVQNGALVL
ncbi:MAG TPA: MauE/DoxX family redox-associated membrane protein, partial [Bacteroidia bacterium]|nr:MauE/DoxX family redox-associated membrane protein [Bacteroidia bacterium]